VADDKIDDLKEGAKKLWNKITDTFDDKEEKKEENV
jgi:hypothetical protein